MTLEFNAAVEPGTPYLRSRVLRSEGRVLLSRALEEYAAVEWGFGPHDIASAFSPGGARTAEQDRVRAHLEVAVDNLVDLLLAGGLPSYSRPFGGGRPATIDSWLWELDDPMPRFAVSAFDPTAPFDAGAAPTHWILVDEGAVADIVQALCGAPPRLPGRQDADADPSSHARGAIGAEGSPPAPDASGLLRLQQVLDLTGMSRSTLYGRIGREEFPEPVRLGPRFSRWRRSDVDRWLSLLP